MTIIADTNIGRNAILNRTKAPKFDVERPIINENIKE